MPAETRVVRELALPESFDAVGLLDWHRARAIPGVEIVHDDGYARTLRLEGGPATVRVALAPRSMSITVDASDAADAEAAIALARRLFDVDRDASAADAALAEHAELAPLVAAVPGIRVPGAVDPAEMLVRAMVGQQITVAAARTALTRLTVELGELVPEDNGLARLFPSMRAIADHGADVLRGPAARIRALTTCARLIAEGEVTMTHDDDPDDLRARLRSLPGVGPWTADYVTMRVTGAPDLLLEGDVAVRAGAALAGIPSDPRGLAAWAQRVAPWRTSLTAHLWRLRARAHTGGSVGGGNQGSQRADGATR